MPLCCDVRSPIVQGEQRVRMVLPGVGFNLGGFNHWSTAIVRWLPHHAYGRTLCALGLANGGGGRCVDDRLTRSLDAGAEPTI